MKPEFVRRKDGKPTHAFDIEIENRYIHQDYLLHQNVRCTVGTTGLLIIFEVEPRISGRPSFIGRWDERAGGLDIDIGDALRGARHAFKKGLKGYSGHHAREMATTMGRAFEIRIQVPNATVFEGEVRFNLHREIELEETLGFSDHVQTLSK